MAIAIAANSISSSAAFMLAAPASEFMDRSQEADGSCDCGEKFQFEHFIVLS